MASAKLANSTVSASHTVTDQSNTLGWTTDSASVITVPTQTTNITGLRSWTRGSSLRTASTAACAAMVRSSSLCLRCGPPGGAASSGT